MSRLLGRAFAALRVWLGLNDPSENRLHPSHGWLLPPVAAAVARTASAARRVGRPRDGGR
jgi:hypothetical protein